MLLYMYLLNAKCRLLDYKLYQMKVKKCYQVNVYVPCVLHQHGVLILLRATCTYNDLVLNIQRRISNDTIHSYHLLISKYLCLLLKLAWLVSINFDLFINENHSQNIKKNTKITRRPKLQHDIIITENKYNHKKMSSSCFRCFL